MRICKRHRFEITTVVQPIEDKADIMRSALLLSIYILFLLYIIDNILGNIMMFFNFIITMIVRTFGTICKWLDQYLILYLVNFAKSFEFAIVIIAAIIFLLISVFLTIRYLKQLPKYYLIEIADIYGKKATVEDLRVVFRTYDAAESYARFYREIYKEQYKFRVVGLNSIT
ncbi:MAG TPA: hypothetical protein VE619_02590 [Nitrososphaeraceae archaeon]|nr:hypothetical protein [Nitrososphaeraceae archaeon]